MSENKSSRMTVLIVACMGSFLVTFSISSLNIALPSIDKDLSLGAIELSWIATAFLLSTAVFMLPFSRISDIYGRKKIFTIGMTINAITSLACLAVNSGTVLIVMRALQGFGGALTLVTGVAMLVSAFPQNERGKALGINSAATYTGLFTGPPIGGFLTQHFGWRSIFAVVGLMALAIAAGVFTNERRMARTAG